MTNNQLTSTHLAVKSELGGYKIHASRGQATAMAMVRLFESIDRDLEELQERRKVERDTEPYGFTDGDRRGMIYKPEHSDRLTEPVPVYRHAQPAPEYPEVLPCSVLLEPGLRFGKGIKTSTMLAALARRAVHESDLAALSPEERAEFQARIEDFKALIAQPAPVVPDKMTAIVKDEAEYVEGWNACRAAMLQASPVCTCPSGDGSLRWPCPVHAGNSPAQSDCCPAQNSATPAQDGNSPVIPDGYVMVPKEPTSEMVKKMRYHVGSYDRNIKDGYKAMLAAAPQSPGSDHATVPGKWIPVNERMPEAEGHYLVWANASRIDGYCDHLAIATYQGGEWSNEFNWLVNHWMPLPAAPQEGK